jgi:dTDP-glucose pyrophosphorylase
LPLLSWQGFYCYQKVIKKFYENSSPNPSFGIDLTYRNKAILEREKKMVNNLSTLELELKKCEQQIFTALYTFTFGERKSKDVFNKANATAKILRKEIEALRAN